MPLESEESNENFRASRVTSFQQPTRGRQLGGKARPSTEHCHPWRSKRVPEFPDRAPEGKPILPPDVSLKKPPHIQAYSFSRALAISLSGLIREENGTADGGILSERPGTQSRPHGAEGGPSTTGKQLNHSQRGSEVGLPTSRRSFPGTTPRRGTLGSWSRA